MPRGIARKSMRLLLAAYAVLEDIQPCTIRAVCYRLFVAGALPDMSKASTDRVSRLLTGARERGEIPWEWIVDETREAERPGTWRDPVAFAAVVRRGYRRDRWQYQPRRVEVWSEKGTVRGTLAPVLSEYGVTFRVMHGFASATAVYQVAEETEGLAAPLLALYVGDFDPSGLYMSEVDLPRRLGRYGANVELKRIALTPDDVVRGDLPAFSAHTKRGDSRYWWYTTRYGARCWEVDALNPVTLRERVADAIRSIIDWTAWERCGRVERAELESLDAVLRRWPAVAGADGRW